MEFKRVKIATTVPHENADAIRIAAGKAGAGKIGDYVFCSYSFTGTGRFIPTSGADPHIGEPGEFEVVEEEYIEFICPRELARQIVSAIKAAHPYEEPVINITPLLEEDSL